MYMSTVLNTDFVRSFDRLKARCFIEFLFGVEIDGGGTLNIA